MNGSELARMAGQRIYTERLRIELAKAQGCIASAIEYPRIAKDDIKRAMRHLAAAHSAAQAIDPEDK